jgi:hypothetical protein
MLELEHEFRVADVHTRLEPDEDRRPRDSPDPDRLEREMHQAGIVRSLVFSGPRERGYLKANNAVARLAVERPFVPLARISGALDPGRRTDAKLKNLVASRAEWHTSPEDVEQYAYDDRFVGFKLNPPADGLPDEEVLEQLQAVGLPVLVHGGQGFPPEAIERTLLKYDFPTIVAHFGGHPLDRTLMTEMIDLLDGHDRCYVDTSYVRFRDPLERAIMEHPDRVLFGSGAPSAHPNVAIMEILTLDVSEDAMRKVFSRNAERVVDALAP